MIGLNNGGLLERPCLGDNGVSMSQAFKLLVSPSLQELYGPALREAGLQFESVDRLAAGFSDQADAAFLDLRPMEARKGLPDLGDKVPVMTLVSESTSRSDLKELKQKGARHLVAENTPASELIVRLMALLQEVRDTQTGEFRSGKRVWFQQEAELTVFDQVHRAWTTTLSETGIFVRTGLSFPLYSTVQLKFQLLGESSPFVCHGVIVRQEVEGPIRGLGIMFQNLSGEQIRRLESFLELCR